LPKIWYTTDAEPLRRQYLEAESLPEALSVLHARGPRVTGAAVQLPPRTAPPRPSWRLLTSVYEQLASLLDQGQELSGALRRLAAESVTARLSRALAALSDRASQGGTLSEAMADQPQLFAEMVVSAVAAAEASGDLPDGLRSLAEHQRELDHLGADLALPLVYPFFLMCVIGLLVIVMPTWLILPKFVSLYRELGLKDDEFPLITRMYMEFSTFIQHFGPPLLIAVVVAAILYLVRSRARAGRLEVRPFGIPVPFFGRLAQSTALARAAASLRLLLRYGVPVHESLRLSGAASGSRHVSLALRRAEYVLREGGSLSQGLRETGLLPESFVVSLAGAEASGDLTEVLRHLETDYLREVNHLSRSWVAVAGPVVVIAMGLVVGTMALATFLPLVTIIQQLSS
jgi:type II secretory pathway component PulF